MSKIHIFKKIQSLFIILICIALFFLQSLVSISSYLKNETGTRTLLLPTSEVDFPELCVCSPNPYNLTILKQNGIKAVPDYTKNSQWAPNIKENKSAEEFYNEIIGKVAEISQILHEIRFEYKTES